MTEPTDRSITNEVAAVFEEQSALVRGSTNPLVKAALGTAPFTGGIVSLLGDIAQKRIEIRLRRFLIAMANRVRDTEGALRQKIDKEFVGSEEFSASLQAILEEAAKTADEKKQSYLRDFLIATGLRKRPDVTWRDIFLQYLRQLSGAHLVTLALFFRVQGDLPDSDRIGGIEIGGKVPLSLAELRAHAEGEFLDNILLKVVCVDLTNMGLLVDWRLLAPEQKTLQERFSISQSGVLFFRFLVWRWQ